MSKKILISIIAVFLVYTMLTPLFAQTVNQLKCAGCKTEFFLLKDLANANPGKDMYTIKPGKTGNKKAIQLLLNNKVDFAFTCKPISKLSKKLKLDPTKIASWKSIAIAKDPIVLVTHSKCTVKNLTVEQITEIFSGKITNWKEVGGPDLPIKVSYIDPKVESGMLLLFKEFTVGKDGALVKTAKTLNDPAKLGNFVSVTPGGITFMGFNSYIKRFGNILNINGVSPSNANIKNGKYKLAATYYLTLASNDDKNVNNFVDFCLSEKGKQIIGKNFVPFSK